MNRDPAVEAAQRAWDGMATADKTSRDAVGIASAREMAKKIRELHKPRTQGGGYICGECTTDTFPWVHWPCATAMLVYTTEELER